MNFERVKEVVLNAGLQPFTDDRGVIQADLLEIWVVRGADNPTSLIAVVVAPDGAHHLAQTPEDLHALLLSLT